jgi:uncharacterized protein
MKICSAFLVAIALTVLPALGSAADPVPAFQGDVLDQSGVLSPAQKEHLLFKIRELRESKNVWMAVYFSQDLQGTTIEDLAHRVFTEWKLGKEKSNNGLLFIAVPNERKMRFEVGYGLEPILTDAWTRRLQEETLKPYFKKSQYSEGISEAIDLIAKKASGQVTDLDDTDEGATVPEILWNRYQKIYRKDTPAALMMVILFLSLTFFGLLLLKKMSLAFLQSRPRTKAIVIAIGGGLGYLIYFKHFVTLFLIAIGGFVAFALYLSRNSRGGGGSSRGGRSSSSSGSGSGSSSSSGSSSGGGSSGGGGSSSSW